MPSIVPRPTTMKKPAGSLDFELFQTAYVTNDLIKAKQKFAECHGVHNWTTFEPWPGVTIGMAWLHGHQIELVHAVGSGHELYTQWIPESSDFVIRLHHFGYFIQNDDEWSEMKQLVEKENRPIIFSGDGGICQFAYVDAPELGHYLEYVYPNEEGIAFFTSIAVN